MTKTKIALFAIPSLAAVLIGAMMLPAYSQVETVEAQVATLEVVMDIKPGSCPNPLNTNTNTAKALVSVVILGDQKLDVTKIKVESLRLNGEAVEGVEDERPVEAVKVVKKVQHVKANYEDLTTPFDKKRDAPTEDRKAYQCNELGGDGIKDLVLKFDRQLLVDTIGDKQYMDPNQADLTFTMTGELLDGTPIKGVDLMVKADKSDKKSIEPPTRKVKQR